MHILEEEKGRHLKLMKVSEHADNVLAKRLKPKDKLFCD